MVMVIYQTLNEIKKLMNSVSPLLFFLHGVREWQVYKDGKMGRFFPSSQQIFRLKSRRQNMWLGMKVLCRFATHGFVDGCVHRWQQRSPLCLVVGQELPRFLDEAREDSVLP